MYKRGLKIAMHNDVLGGGILGRQAKGALIIQDEEGLDGA